MKPPKAEQETKSRENQRTLWRVTAPWRLSRIIYLLCCFNSFILHPQHGKSFQENILCGFWHRGRQRNSQRLGCQAAQVFDWKLLTKNAQTLVGQFIKNEYIQLNYSYRIQSINLRKLPAFTFEVIDAMDALLINMITHQPPAQLYKTPNKCTYLRVKKK